MSQTTNAIKFGLTVVRHGQTVWNLHKLIQGHRDTPLTDLGYTQAETLGSYFAENNFLFTKIYTSDLARARKTTEIIATKLLEKVETCPPVKDDDRLRERSYGDRFEGTPIANLQEEAYKHNFNEHNFTQYAPDGVESIRDVRQRLGDFFTNELWLNSEADDKILLVSHWGTIKEIFRILASACPDAIEPHHCKETPNVAFSDFAITLNKDTRALEKVEVIGLHQTHHLDDTQKSVNLKLSLH